MEPGETAINAEPNPHIEDLHIEPWPDGQRIRVHLSLAEFSTRPNLEAVIITEDGEEIQSVHIIENMDQRLVFTMHLRGAPIPGKFILSVSLYDDPETILDQRSIHFEIS